MEMAEPEYLLLAAERDRAERKLNVIRAIIVGALALAAVAYAPTLSPRLNRVNAFVIIPVAAWTSVQYLWLYRRPALPTWLTLANPVADVAAITFTIGGYGLEATSALGLKSPMVIAYLIVLAARPIASSVRIAGVVAALVFGSYILLDFVLIHHAGTVLGDPVTASTTGSISLLDEGTKIVLLAIAGFIATYATWWHQRLAFQYARESHEREALQAGLASSRLDSLKQQLRPHFLFNALNTIAAQVDTDPRAAQQTIAGLGALIRASLDADGKQVVSLDDELRVLSHYIAIQTIRFAGRIAIVIEVEDAVRNALVPALILQPLVENAITHGVGKRNAPGRIVVHAHSEGQRLALWVTDDGPGLSGQSSARIHERIGVGNARSRLSYLYGDDHEFAVIAPIDGGFTVRMMIPLRVADASSESRNTLA